MAARIFEALWGSIKFEFKFQKIISNWIKFRLCQGSPKGASCEGGYDQYRQNFLGGLEKGINNNIGEDIYLSFDTLNNFGKLIIQY